MPFIGKFPHPEVEKVMDLINDALKVADQETVVHVCEDVFGIDTTEAWQDEDGNELPYDVEDFMAMVEGRLIDAFVSLNLMELVRLEDAGGVLVSITNTYEDGHESESEVWVTAPPNETMPSEEWWEKVVFPHTGDGHGENLRAVHEATIMRVSDPNDTTMCGLSNTWEG